MVRRIVWRVVLVHSRKGSFGGSSPWLRDRACGPPLLFLAPGLFAVCFCHKLKFTAGTIQV